MKKEKENFKNFLEQEFESSKNYKSELKWFDGAWSRFKPGLGKDKRGVSGVEKSKLIEIGQKISSLPEDFNTHKTLKKIFDLRKSAIKSGKAIDWSTAESLSFWNFAHGGFFSEIIWSRFR